MTYHLECSDDRVDPTLLHVKVTFDPDSLLYPAMLPVAENFTQMIRENIEHILREIRKSKYHQLEFNWPNAD